jgi:cytochrome c oxidase subunit 3
MIFRQLREKPWETASSTVNGRQMTGAPILPPVTLGLRMFLVVVTVLFMLLIIAYGGRMAFEDWRPGPQLRLLWLNTALLIASSAAMHWAWLASRHERINGVRNGLIAGGVFAFSFLAGQIVAWRQIGTMAFFDVTNPAIAFFYLITALHALHLAGGIVAWGRTTLNTWNDDCEMADVKQSVELCTVYWHFLLLIWLVLFGLLFSGNDNLGILLSICGIT